MRLEKKNHCETVRRNKKGKPIKVKNKVKYSSKKGADEAAKRYMLDRNFKIKEILEPYKCKICGKYHIGRNGKPLTETYKRKLMDEYFENKSKDNAFNIVGSIDLPN